MTDKTDAQTTHDKLRSQAINLRALHQSLDGLSVDRIDGMYFRALVSAIGAHAEMLEDLLPAPTPPTMADVEWDGAAHAGLCAEHPVYGAVRMVGANPAGDINFLYAEEGRLRSRWTHPANLTPAPGTKIDLTPRREPEPESAPEHPEVLITEEDYEGAPTGTIAFDDDGAAVKDVDGRWRWTGSGSTYRSDDLCYGEADPMTVVRWGK